MKATLKEIAEEAGVNVSTASRALSGTYGVRKQTRERVLSAAKRLNYRPNLMARGLVTGKSHTIGLVVSDIRNPYFAEVARGAEDAAFAASFDVILCNSDLNPSKQLQYVRSLLEKNVEGILMNSVAALTADQRAELGNCGVPVVLLNHRRGNTLLYGRRGQLSGWVASRRVSGEVRAPQYCAPDGASQPRKL